MILLIVNHQSLVVTKANRIVHAAQKRFFNEHPLLTGIASLAEKENLEVIAEAWDLWGYEVGNFPRGWGEWNGRYRDAVRRFTKGDGNTADFLDMVNGDYHHFEDNGGPQKSINFIVAHDGFNLADLVSYQTKDNNQPYPFGPSDDNMSWDSGGDPALRRQRLRNLWAILMLSRGVPMVVAGDEFGRTQNGNNNPWALDSPAMRNNYAMIATSAPQRVAVEDGTGAAYHDNLGVFDSRDERVNPLFRFATFLMRLRHRHPALCRAAWGDMEAGGEDVSYLFRAPDGNGSPREGDRALAVHIDAPDDGFWVMINMSPDPVDFRVPAAGGGDVWRRLVDTAVGSEKDDNCWPEGEGEIVVDGVVVQPWSVVATTKSKSYRSVLKAIIDGQTDPDELLRLVHGRILNKHGHERVKAALTGSFSETDLIVLRQMGQIDIYPTLLQLLVIPCVYYMFEQLKSKVRREE